MDENQHLETMTIAELLKELSTRKGHAKVYLYGLLTAEYPSKEV